MTIKDYFNKLASHWDDDMTAIDDKRRIVAMLSDASKAKNILDVACGTGAMFQAYEEVGASHVTAIDLAPNMIEVAKEKVKDNPVFTVEVADLYDIGPDQYDLVIIYNAYPHFIDRERLTKKVADLLVDGGRFVVAHGAGKDTINAHHANIPKEVTSELNGVEIEGPFWEPYFAIDMQIDTDEFYFLSGKKKARIPQ